MKHKTLKEVIEYMKDAGFKIDYEMEDAIWKVQKIIFSQVAGNGFMLLIEDIN